MFAPQNQQPNVIDSMTGSMEEWYNAVDEAVKKSEVIPGNYEYTVATSYGNVGKIAEDASTYFDVSCDRFKVVSLDNSYLTIEQDIKINIPTQNALMYSTYYIGYKYAADCIDQYRIYSNTDLVQTTGTDRKKPDAGLDLVKYRATAICFEDALLKIRAVKPDGRSQIEITNASIEQVLMGQAV